MKLFRNYMKKCIKISAENKMRVRVIGDPRAFDEDLQKKIQELEEYSSQYDELHFQIALNYGSRDEMKRAMQHMAEEVQKGNLQPEEITEETSSSYLDTRGLPDPDLLIRTSGEERFLTS